MSDAATDTLSPEAELALAWSSPKVRGPLSIAFKFDRRLARIVARTNEPMLGQMRLAWWREALGKPPEARPQGDTVLDALGVAWAGQEAALVQMIDAWEILITAEHMDTAQARAFGAGRGVFFGALGSGAGEGSTQRLATAGLRWALADAVTAVSDAAERRVMIAAGLAEPSGKDRFPAQLRGFAVLEALALRALRRGGRPLMDGRGAPLTALRAAIFRG